MGGEDRADGHPLLLAPGQGAQVAGAQGGDAEQVERLLDPAAHGVRRDAELLHAVGELLLDRVGDEARDRVLADVADDVRALARREVDDAPAVEQDVPGEGAAAEARHQPGEHAEQGGLADPGAPGDEHQLALVEGQVDAVEDGRRGVVVREADVAQLDHAPTPSAGAIACRGGGAATAGRRPSSTAPSAATLR